MLPCFFLLFLLAAATAHAAGNDELNNKLIKSIDPFGRVNMVAVKEALAQGADPDARDADGKTALEIAVNGVLPDAVSLLLEHGADPNTRDKQGRTPLMYVGFFLNPKESDKLEVTRRLVEKGADVNAVDSYDTDVLSFLVPYNLPTVIDYLIEHGAKVNRQDKQGRTPLLHAAEEGKTEVVRVLLKHDADPGLKPSSGGWSALDAAIHYKHQDIVELMTQSVKPGAANSGLITAAAEGLNDMVRKFIAQKADLNAQNEAGMTAVMAAVDKAHADTVKILLEAGANPDLVDKGGYGSINGETALCMASRNKSLEIVSVLLQVKADVDARCGAVVAAAHAGSAEIVKALADAGADMKDRFTGHWQALFTAAESGNAEIVRIMLDHGTPVDMRDNMDSTALMVASGKGNLDVIRLLAERKADLEAVNSKRPISDVGSNLVGTPLMWAMEAHQQAAVDLLLSLGAKPKEMNVPPMTEPRPVD